MGAVALSWQHIYFNEKNIWDKALLWLRTEDIERPEESTFMAIPPREQRILSQRSGNRCAFPNCRRRLTAEDSPPDRAVILGEIAHIVAESPDGPRGDSPLSLTERNKYENLILLCNIHHQLIDDQPQTYTVER